MSWDKVKLGDILLRRRELVNVIPNEEYKLVTIKLHHKGVVLRKVKKGAEIKSKMSKVRSGDFVLSGIDARNGAFGIVPEELDNAIITNDFWCLLPNEKIIKKEFLLFLTSTPYFDFICNQSSDGTTQRIRLQKDKFFNYEITVPPIEEQDKILRKLNSKKVVSEKLNSEQNTQLSLLKKLRQQILQDAVQGKLIKSSRAGGREGVKNTTPFRNAEHSSLQGGELKSYSYQSISNLPYLKTFRKNLRNHLTPAEATLWTLLSNRKLAGRKFRRQHSIGNYILDFFCPGERLGVELDGEVHMNTIAEEYDRERDIFLLHTGIKVIRFENKTVFDMPESVLKEIEDNFGWWEEEPPRPGKPGHPSLQGGEQEETTPFRNAEHPSLQGGEHLEDARELLEKIRDEKQKLIAEGKIKKGKPLPPVKPEEIPFEIPENWEWCRLGEIGAINPRNYLSDDLDVSFIPMTMISEKYGVQPEYEIRKWKDIKSGFTHFAKNDVAVAKITPCFENSKACVFKNLSNDFGAGTTELHVFRGNTESLSPDYIYINLKTSKFLVNGERIMRGVAGQQRIPTDYFRDYLIPLPPHEEQHRIVTKVERLMALCDELEQSIQQNQEYTQELLQVALKEALEPEK